MTDSATWSERWAERSSPAFGQLVTWFLLIAGVVMTVQSYEMAPGARSSAPSTVLSWLPPDWLARGELFHIFRGLFLVGGSLWAVNRFLPWSCWLATTGFIGLWAMHLENTWAGAHIFHAAAMLLVVQSLWCSFCGREITAAWNSGHYWNSPVYPRWVYLLGLAYLGLFITYAGLAKLLYSGSGWANGLSLQLWVHMDGYRWSPLTHLVLENRTITRFLQILTLVVETAGILALPFPRLRIPIGLGLCGFYCGVLLIFPYGFLFNLILTAAYFFPLEAWLRHRYPICHAGNPPAF